MNIALLVGRLTAAPVLKTTTSGTPVTTFSLAVDRRFQTKDGERQADFINCVAWRSNAEFISKYFKKGDPIAIQGEIQTRNYTDKDGNKRVAVEVVIDNARFVPSKSNTSDNTPPAFSNGEFTEISINDDLPF